MRAAVCEPLALAGRAAADTADLSAATSAATAAGAGLLAAPCAAAPLSVRPLAPSDFHAVKVSARVARAARQPRCAARRRQTRERRAARAPPLARGAAAGRRLWPGAPLLMLTCRPRRAAPAPSPQAAHGQLFPIDYDDGFFHKATHGLDRCAAVCE